MAHRPDYLVHLLEWATPVLFTQWLLAPKVLARHLGPIALAVGLSTAYLSAADALAIRSGIWGFGQTHLLGIALGPVPLEEILFFFSTSLLVCQGVVLVRHALGAARVSALGSD